MYEKIDGQHSNLILLNKPFLFGIKIVFNSDIVYNFVFTYTIFSSQEPFVNHLESRWTPVVKVVKKPAPPENFWWVPVVVLREPDTDIPLTNFSTRPQVWMKPDQHELTLEGFNDDHKWVVLNPGTIGKLKATTLV